MYRARKAYLALAFAVAFSTYARASSFLGDAPVRKHQVQDVLEHQPVRGEPLCQRQVCPLRFMCSPQIYHSIRFQTIGPIETTMCDYETIESVNEELYANLHELVQTPFFRYFQVHSPLQPSPDSYST